MENINEILNELRQISAMVAGIKRENLWVVPHNYFEQLAGSILLRIHSNQGDEPLPASFDNLHKTIPLTPPPAGYFDDFAVKVLARIQAEAASSAADELALLSPLLSRIKKDIPFSVPDGYFEELSENALSSAQAVDLVNEELENLSQMMMDLKDKNVYSVPSGYFDGLASRIVAKTKTISGRAPVISLAGRKTWLRLAAAAIVAGIIMTVGVFVWQNKSHPAPVMSDPIASLSKVSDDEMISYLQNQDLPIGDTISNPLATIDLSGNDDGHDLLSNITDEELQQYVNEAISFKETQSN